MDKVDMQKIGEVLKQKYVITSSTVTRSLISGRWRPERLCELHPTRGSSKDLGVLCLENETLRIHDAAGSRREDRFPYAEGKRERVHAAEANESIQRYFLR